MLYIYIYERERERERERLFLSQNKVFLLFWKKKCTYILKNHITKSRLCQYSILYNRAQISFNVYYNHTHVKDHILQVHNGSKILTW